MDTEKDLRSLFDAFPVAVAITRIADNAVAYVNPRLLEAFGETDQTAVLGHGIAEWLHPDYLEKAGRNIAAILSGSPQLDDPRYVLVKADGTTLDADIFAVPTQFEGEPALLSLLIDVSDMERANRERAAADERYRALVEMSPDAQLVHRGGKLLYVNPAGLRLVGAERLDGVVGRPIMDFVPPEARERVGERVRALVDTGEPTEVVEEVLARSDGTTVPVEVRSVPVTFDGEPAVQTIARDLSWRVEERAAREIAESRAQAIVGAIPLGMHFYRMHNDGALDFVGANPAADTILGIDHDDLIGLTIEEAFPTLRRTSIPETYRQVVRTGIAWHNEEVNYEDDRIASSFDVDAFRIGPDQMVASFSDITDRKRAEEEVLASRRLLRDILDTVPVRVFWKDRDLKYLGCNLAFARDAGMDTPESVVGKDDSQLAWREQAELYGASDASVISTGESRLGFEEPRTTTEGETIWLRKSKVPLRNAEGEVVGVLGVYDDITAHRAAERELDLHRHHLEELVEQRTEQLALANAQLEKADQAKSAFLASMSHELRTPLNSIIGFSSLLAQGISGPLSPEQQRQVEMINHSGRQLLSLVGDVLDLAKIEAGRVELMVDEFDVPGLARSLAESVRPMALEKDLDVDTELEGAPASMVGDREKIEQIVLNFLSNAIKYTDAGSVTLKVADRRDGTVAFSVSDTGQGIPVSEHERIFEEFRQLPSASAAKSPGSGLGLAISRHLAGFMGGTIELASQVGSGSKFTLVVPLG
jgi:PAS domain S-box-containing protein